MQTPRWFVFVVGALVAAWMLHAPVVAILVDWLWFDAIGYLGIFETTLSAKVLLWVVGAGVTAAFMALNLRIATRLAPINTMRLSMLLAEGNMNPRQLRNLVRASLAAVVVLPSLLFGTVAASQWLDVLAYQEREPFGTVDPVFDKDIGFYIFQLPLWELGQSLLVNLFGIALIPCLLLYGLNALLAGHEPAKMPKAQRAHLLGLVAAIFLGLGAGWMLERFDLLFQHNGVVWGIGYTDAATRLPGYAALAGIAAVSGLGILFNIPRSGWRGPFVVVGLYTVARILVAGVWPSITQDYYVKPNELELEREYLESNISLTNAGFALDRIEVKPFNAEATLTMADIESNPLTLDNVRVWDTRPLLSTYSQLQEIRLYYDFLDVDVDRYVIDGKLRQVMLSAREMNYQNVPAQAKSWVNEHFQYTHGYGLTLSPVNVVLPNGMPKLFVKDIPPTSETDLEITRPEIYYGEIADDYVLVGTTAEEFDYPSGDANVYTQYKGKGGVPIGTLGKKALFSVWFKSFNILLSKYLQPESKIMMHRQISERISHLTPFLHFDHDPYLVVADGRLHWMIDAYTTSNKHPYSEPVRVGRSLRLNYIRNSVKVVVDAYNGSVDYFISDTEDPLIRVYGKIFPGVFKPLEEMPEFLQPHIRYPADFFDIQSTMYRAYHMTDPTVFYNKEDMWEIPQELYGRQEQAMESYTLIMKLPGEEDAEFILLMPFVPTRRDNMIAWLAGRSDAPHYGKLVLYQFPKKKLIYGPRQIEARIDQDPEISELMTLWSQAGSRVVRGNLIVIPVEDNLMYVEPLYLQAESSQLPELKRVIVTYGDKIAMRTTLDEALRAVFDQAPLVAPAVDAGEGEEATEDGQPAVILSQTWQTLAQQANSDLEAATEAQQAGDWAGYGEALEALTETLEALEDQSGD